MYWLRPCLCRILTFVETNLEWFCASGFVRARQILVYKRAYKKSLTFSLRSSFFASLLSLACFRVCLSQTCSACNRCLACNEVVNYFETTERFFNHAITRLYTLHRLLLLPPVVISLGMCVDDIKNSK